MLQFRALSRRLLLPVAAFLRGSCGALLILFSCGTSATPGQFDPSFGGDGRIFATTGYGSDLGNAIAVQADAKVLVAGACTDSSGTSKACILRYTENGASDSNFGVAGTGKFLFQMGSAASGALAVTLQADGKIVVAGWCTIASARKVCVARLLSTGQLDSSFASFGVATISWAGASPEVAQITVVSGGRMLIAGTCRPLSYDNFCLTALTPSGSIDTTFASGEMSPGTITRQVGSGGDTLSGIGIQPNGQIVLAGSCFFPPATGPLNFYCLARFNSDGTYDASFGGSSTGNTGKVLIDFPSAGYDYRLRAMAVGIGGEIVAVGQCGPASTRSTCSARLDGNGVLDSTFGAGGKAIVRISDSDNPSAVALMSGGKSYVSGICSVSQNAQFCVARFDTLGALDPGYASGGSVSFDLGMLRAFLRGAAQDHNQKVVTVGSCFNQSSASLLCLARLKSGPYNPLACALNTDANNTIESSSDAMLILRYLLGYRGNALTEGALGANPTRTGAALETYLASLNLDADGDGQAHAMTDGLLILRAMLGLSGNALTAGAVNTSSPTVRNAQQILTWIETTHGVACLP